MQIEDFKKFHDEMKAQLDATQKKLDTTTEEKHNAIKNAAVWESKYEELKEVKQPIKGNK